MRVTADHVSHWLQVRGLRDNWSWARKTCRRYSIWKTFAGFKDSPGKGSWRISDAATWLWC